MKKVLEEKYSRFKEKIYLLSHAYDPEKFSRSYKNEKRTGFIYGGTIYSGIIHYIEAVAKVINNNKEFNFKWQIYSRNKQPLIESLFNEENVKVYSFLPEEELFEKIRHSTAYLAVYPDSDKDLISTKFFEIIYSETPIIYIGEEGEISKFIKKYNLGTHILPCKIEEDLPKLLTSEIKFENKDFDVTQYTFSKITDKLLYEIKLRMRT